VSSRLSSIHVSRSSLREIRWYEYALRFLQGGLVTVATGLIAKRFGPEIGGLFLAFPAIFPASVTLITKHEREKKAKQGLDGTARGRQVAARDAAGAELGAIGLLCFAAWVWRALPHLAPVVVLLGGAGIWVAVALALWARRKDCWLTWARGAPPAATPLARSGAPRR